MPQELKDLFKKLFELSEVKQYQDKPLNTYLEELWDKASAKETMQEINKDLVSQRAEWKVKEQNYKSTLEDLTKLKLSLENERQNLLTSQLTEAQKAQLAKGLTPEMEAIMNTLKKTVEEQGTQLSTLQSTLQETAKAKEQAQLKADKQELNSKLTQALMNHKIKDSAQVTAALALINAQKMATIERDDTGAIKHIFSYIENGKPYSFTNENELAKYVAEKNQYLVSASTKPGGGNIYNPSSTNYGEDYTVPQDLRDARAKAAQQFEKYFKQT